MTFRDHFAVLYKAGVRRVWLRDDVFLLAAAEFIASKRVLDPDDWQVPVCDLMFKALRVSRRSKRVAA